MRFASWATSHVGTVREMNEDRFLCRPDLGLWIVADGAGGHEAGEFASGLIVSDLNGLPADLSGAQLLSEVRLTIGRTHQALRDEAARRGDRMIASTIAVLILRDRYFACLWAGDSRIYRLRDGNLQQLTRDHSVVQELIDEGRLTEEQAKTHPHANIITLAIGADCESVMLDKVIGQIEPQDRYLLCSDGLCKIVSAEEITAILGAPDVSIAPDMLIAAALAHRGDDNVTAVVVAAG